MFAFLYTAWPLAVTLLIGAIIAIRNVDFQEVVDDLGEGVIIPNLFLLLIGVCTTILLLTFFGRWHLTMLTPTLTWCAITAIPTAYWQHNDWHDGDFARISYQRFLALNMVTTLVVGFPELQPGWQFLLQLAALVGYILVACIREGNILTAIGTLLLAALSALLLLGTLGYLVFSERALPILFQTSLLSLVYAPFVCLHSITNTYTRIWRTMRNRFPAAIKLQTMARLLRIYGINVIKIARWQKLAVEERPTDQDGLDSIFTDILTGRKIPDPYPYLSHRRGWPQDLAERYLHKFKKHILFISPLKFASTGTFAPRPLYGVEGSFDYTRRLMLRLDNEDHWLLYQKCCKQLYEAAIQEAMPDSLQHAIQMKIGWEGLAGPGEITFGCEGKKWLFEITHVPKSPGNIPVI